MKFDYWNFKTVWNYKKFNDIEGINDEILGLFDAHQFEEIDGTCFPIEKSSWLPI